MAEPMTTRFEADLAAALDAYAEGAPVAVDAAAITRAVATARPRRRWAPATDAWRTLRLAVLLAALLALLIATLLASGTLRVPLPDPPARFRALVSDGVTAWIVGPDRTVTVTDRPELPRSTGCWLIGGTHTLMGNNYTTWAFASLSDEPLPIVTAGASYGGGERWSPDRRKVALVAASEGRITILDFTDPGEVGTTPLDLPDAIGAGWLPGSDAMVVVRRVADDAVEIVIAGLDGTVSTPQRVDIGRFTSSDDFEMLEPIVSPDGRSVLLAGVQSDRAVLDDAPLPVLADDGRLRVLGPAADPMPSWSPSSDRVAWLTGRRLAVIDGGAARHLELPDGVAGPTAWLSPDRLLVSGTDRAWIIDPLKLEVAGTLLDPDTAGLWSVAGDRVVRTALDAGVLRVRWYRPDGTPDGPDLVLTDPDRAAVGEPACVDVQPLPD